MVSPPLHDPQLCTSSFCHEGEVLTVTTLCCEGETCSIISYVVVGLVVSVAACRV